MENEIAVSVFCAAYNHEKYIKKTLEGFVKQKTNFAFEVLVHDDASTDGTPDIIREYETKYPEIIKPIYQTENQYSQNISIGKTYLFPRARGKYIAFCEGDDFWVNDNKLQLQYDAMELHPQCVACVGKVKTCEEDGKENNRIIPPNDSQIIQGIISQKEFSQLLFVKIGYCFQTSSYFLRRCVYEYAMDAEYRHCFSGDQTYLRTFLKMGSIYYIEQELSCYRLMSKGSWNEREKNKTIEQRIERMYKNIEGEKVFDENTDYVYHREIECSIFQRLSGIAEEISSCESKSEITKLLKNFDMTFNNFFKYLDKKHRMRVILVCYFPCIWRLYKAIK